MLARNEASSPSPQAQSILAEYVLGQEPLGKGKEWELGTFREPDLGFCACYHLV